MLSGREEYGAGTVVAPPEVRPDGRLSRTLRRVNAHAVHLVSTFLGDDVVGRRVRSLVLRAAGSELGRGATLTGGTFVSNPSRLALGAGSYVGRSCYLDLEADLVIGARVSVGHGTSFITTRHEMGPAERRCGPFTGDAITVGDGAWVGANVTVLPGVSIGSGAVVAAGAVVSADVPSSTVVAGVPARVIRTLGPDGL